MLGRREFIGTTAVATCLLAGRWSLAAAVGQDWTCEIIQTVPQSPWMRAPVVTAVSIQPGGRHLAIVGDDHFINIFNLQDREFIRGLDQHRDWVRAARFSPDGAWLATGGNDRQLLLWESATWQAPKLLARHPQAIADIAFSPDGTRLACVGFEPTIRVYDVIQRRLIGEWEAPCNDMHAVAFSADGEWVVSGGRSGVIRGIRAANGAESWDAAAHGLRVRGIACDRHHRVLSCGDDQMVRVAPLRDAERPELRTRWPSKLFAAVWIDDQLCATAGADNQITFWDVATSEATQTLTGHTGTVTCLDFRDGMLVSGSFDTQVRVWKRRGEVITAQENSLPRDGWNHQIK